VEETVYTWALFKRKHLNIYTKVRFTMTPIVKLYWLRVLLGAIAGVVSAILATWVYAASDYTPLLNSITVALALYVVTYYLVKGKLKDKIEQQSKILSTAIGMYFFTWITIFVLSYTAIQVFAF